MFDEAPHLTGVISNEAVLQRQGEISRKSNRPPLLTLPLS
jgi:hypothetical protein